MLARWLAPRSVSSASKKKDSPHQASGCSRKNGSTKSCNMSSKKGNGVNAKNASAQRRGSPTRVNANNGSKNRRPPLKKLPNDVLQQVLRVPINTGTRNIMKDAHRQFKIRKVDEFHRPAKIFISPNLVNYPREKNFPVNYTVRPERTYKYEISETNVLSNKNNKNNKIHVFVTELLNLNHDGKVVGTHHHRNQLGIVNMLSYFLKQEIKTVREANDTFKMTVKGATLNQIRNIFKIGNSGRSSNPKFAYGISNDFPSDRRSAKAALAEREFPFGRKGNLWKFLMKNYRRTYRQTSLGLPFNNLLIRDRNGGWGIGWNEGPPVPPNVLEHLTYLPESNTFLLGPPQAERKRKG